MGYHKDKSGLVTLFAHLNPHPCDNGVLIAGDDGSVERCLTKKDIHPQWHRNRVNAGFHIINASIPNMVGM